MGQFFLDDHGVSPASDPFYLLLDGRFGDDFTTVYIVKDGYAAPRGRTMVTRVIFSTVFIQLDDGVTCEHPHPEMVPNFTHVELCPGIGGFGAAADFFGIPTVLAVDSNIHTISYHRNTVGATINSFPPSAVCGRIQNPRIMGQSCKLQPGFMSGGFPCQPLS